MKYLRYAGATLLNLIFTGLACLLAPGLALFVQSNGYLPNWLVWFETEDAPIDAGWQGLYFVVPTTLTRWQSILNATGWYYSGTGTPTGFNLYVLRVRWLWRNPAYGFCYWPLGIAYDPTEWVIDTLEHDGATLTLLKAHTIDGRYFAYTDAAGAKYGYKLWWAFDANFNLPATMPLTKGTDNRLPICFTPHL
ncbi:DUF7338 family protein [Pararobbsia silviterrae]|uniref:Uncharacterized protein n=1 Tax=Pararobbsia silviterrae TaxID=1792498 RepID=A0A494X2Z5_9BURK|nr:hypothetical protein [Pararobbsia silviterrae]RKP44720.1 hypothetical protein D7S86_27240 [Pararobbsia silviterrae]